MLKVKQLSFVLPVSAWSDSHESVLQQCRVIELGAGYPFHGRDTPRLPSVTRASVTLRNGAFSAEVLIIL